MPTVLVRHLKTCHLDVAIGGFLRTGAKANDQINKKTALLRKSLFTERVLFSDPPSPGQNL